MVTGVAATMSEKPTATSVVVSDRKIRRPAPEVPMPTQKIGQWLVTALLSWWPIYTPHPGHLNFAGVAGHPTHTQEHLQAIQEHKDQIISP